MLWQHIFSWCVCVLHSLTMPLYTVQYTHSASLHCAVHTQCLSTLCSTHTHLSILCSTHTHLSTLCTTHTRTSLHCAVHTRTSLHCTVHTRTSLHYAVHTRTSLLCAVHTQCFSTLCSTHTFHGQICCYNTN